MKSAMCRVSDSEEANGPRNVLEHGSTLEPWRSGKTEYVLKVFSWGMGVKIKQQQSKGFKNSMYSKGEN